MNINKIRSKDVMKYNEKFILHLGISYFDLGIQIHSWGIRIMLITHHFCIHIKD